MSTPQDFHQIYLNYIIIDVVYQRLIVNCQQSTENITFLDWQFFANLLFVFSLILHCLCL